jgi:hypothetical protein
MGHDFVLVKDGDAGLPISIIDVWELHRYTDVFCRYRLSFFCVGTCQLEKCQRLSFFFGTDDVVYVMACQPRARDMVGVILPIEYR